MTTTPLTVDTHTCEVRRDIAYREDTGYRGCLDFLRPADRECRPCVVCIHGGAWMSGSKEDELGICLKLVDAGFAAAAVNYRLTDEAPFPAQIWDVQAAVRFLRHHAEELRLDPDRIGATGGSAGGHLACMLALTELPEPDATWPDHSSRVQAVADRCGPTDFTKPRTDQETNRVLDAFLAGDPATLDERRRAASPVHHVGPHAPPFLILHGEADETVPVRGAEGLARRLRDAGNEDVTLVIRPETGHNLNGPQCRFRAENRQLIADFFRRTLRIDEP